MKLIRTLFIAAAVLLPVSWTVAKAGETAAPAAEGAKDKKSKGTETAPAGGAEKAADKKAADKK